ncbi:MAG: Ankyrin-2 [Bathelium mastoideum]|nr:MAG: Ankyrin-2 [Bathelium mastoideum]
MEWTTESPSSEEPRLELMNVSPVVVAGLRDDKDDTIEYSAWENYWTERLRVPDFPTIITFDPGLNENDKESDILSPSWFNRMARNLLEEVRSKREQGKQLAFFGESLGGVVLKKALILAHTEEEYADIVLLGVPGTIPSPRLWTQILMSLILPFWQSLPPTFWSSTASLPEYLDRISSEFVSVAFRMQVITVHDFHALTEFRRSHETPYPRLYLSHELIIGYPSWSKHVAKFDRYDNDAVEEIYQALSRAASVSPDSRDYLRRLSLTSSSTEIFHLEKVRKTVEEVITQLHCDDVSAVIIQGPHGSGKHTLLYSVYSKLLFHRTPSISIAYFSFDSWDHRRRSVSTMLAEIIKQLLACEPELLMSLQKILSNDDEETQWTEGNLWVQLRFIIRTSSCSTIYLVIDSLSDCSTADADCFIRDLFNLRFAALERLKMVCSNTATLVGFTTPAIVPLDLFDLREYKDYVADFQDGLVDELVAENPKLESSRTKVKECFKKSQHFFHSTLLAHRMRTISSLSRPVDIEEDLSGLDQGWEGTITNMMSAAPPWVATAVSWMMLVHRPLRPTELAVAFSLATNNRLGSLEEPTEFDERIIPLDIQGDLVRHLGPLVRVECGQITISHVCIEEVLRNWLDKTESDTRLREKLLTTQLMDYLRFCLTRILADDQNQIPNELRFGFLEYCLEHWHTHYRTVMDDVGRPLLFQSTEKWLEDVVLSFFRNAECRRWLQPANPYGLESQSQSSKAARAIDALELAARFGLFDIFVQLTSKDSDSEQDKKSSQISAFQYACQYGHGRIVGHLINRLDDVVIEPELIRACRRGDEAIVMLMLDPYLATRDSAGFPRNLLPEACRMGHTSLVGKLIQEGAKVNEYSETDHRLPLHEAVDQGHLDIVELLLEKKADATASFSDDGSTPLLHSIERGYRPISDRLLGVDGMQDTPNKYGVTALHLAARRGDVDLLTNILNIFRVLGPRQQQSTSPLHEAAAHGHLNAVTTLLQHFPDIINELNSEGKSALFLALRNDHRNVVNYLFSQNPKIEFVDIYADSALKQAIIHGNLEATEALLDLLGENINSYKDTKSSPLTDAAWKDHSNIIQVLLRAGADPLRTVEHEVSDDILGESPDGEWTAIHFAAYYNREDVMRVLMSDRAELANFATSASHTPLHLAVAKDWDDVVGVMLPGAKEAAGVLTGAKRRMSTTNQTLRQREGIIVKESPTISSTPQSLPEGEHPLPFDIDAQTDYELTALHIALANGSIEIAKMLIVSGADVNLFDLSRRAAVHFAAAARNCAADMLRLLLQPGPGRPKADVHSRDIGGNTPLHYAAEGSDEATVLLLLAHGANPNTTSAQGMSPLYLAAGSGRIEIVRCLLEHGADVLTSATSDEWHSVLYAAVSGGNHETVQMLLDRGANANARDIGRDTPLHEAARRGNLEMVRTLLNAGADINAINSRFITPLQRAILNQETETAKELISRGAEPNIRDEDGDTALSAAIYSKELDLVKVLLNGGADKNVLNRSEKTPLMLVLRYPKDFLPVLIDAKPSVLRCGDSKVTVLHYAAAETPDASVDGVLQLLQYGKDDLNVRDFEGQAPVHHAARHGRAGMLKALQNHGADMCATDAQGRTAMHHAVRSMSHTDFAKAFEQFLKVGKDNRVNVPDADGWTPLHWACRCGTSPIVDLLLDGCDTVRDRRKMILGGKHGWTALAVAEFHHQVSIVKALESALEAESYMIEAAGSTTAIRTVPNDSGATRDAGPIRLPSAKPGFVNEGVECDDCLFYVSAPFLSYAFITKHLTMRTFWICTDASFTKPMCGLRFKCKQHTNFDLCFKCYWHYKKTHRPQGHEFERRGRGPAKSPEFIDPPPMSPPMPPPLSPMAPPVRSMSRSVTFNLDEPVTDAGPTASTSSTNHDPRTLFGAPSIVSPAVSVTDPGDDYFIHFDESHAISRHEMDVNGIYVENQGSVRQRSRSRRRKRQLERVVIADTLGETEEIFVQDTGIGSTPDVAPIITQSVQEVQSTEPIVGEVPLVQEKPSVSFSEEVESLGHPAKADMNDAKAGDVESSEAPG